MAFNENKPVHNSDLSSSEIRENFKHLKQTVSKEHAWNDGDPNGSYHRLDQMRITVGGSQQGATRAWGSAPRYSDKSYKSINLGVVETNSGLVAGSYSLQNILQHLVNSSHTHYLTTVTMNCNCNCDCNCGGNN